MLNIHQRDNQHEWWPAAKFGPAERTNRILRPSLQFLNRKTSVKCWPLSRIIGAIIVQSLNPL
jgi:hypothetical protein